METNQSGLNDSRIRDDYQDCVINNIDQDVLDDDLYELVKDQLEDITFVMYVSGVNCATGSIVMDEVFRRLGPLIKKSNG